LETFPTGLSKSPMNTMHEAEQFDIPKYAWKEISYPPPRPQSCPCPTCGRPQTNPHKCDHCRVCVVHCSRCGKGRIIASGYNAIDMKMSDKLISLTKMGWTFDTGVFLCRNCSCPMTMEEKAEYQSLQIKSLRPEKNWMLQQFVQMMTEKYGEWPIALYTSTPDDNSPAKITSQS